LCSGSITGTVNRQKEEVKEHGEGKDRKETRRISEEGCRKGSQRKEIQ
jgi:hypothetical protein